MASQATWRDDLRGAVAGILIEYYSRDLARLGFSVPDCLADEGDECYGGDHEDQRCLRVPRCRDEAEVEDFLGRLAQAALLETGDAQAVAQAAYAFARLGRLGEALRLAASCRAQEWWCSLVRGMALHRAGRSTEAEVAFGEALAEADSALSCRLREIDELLEERDRQLYRSLACGARGDFERRFWWLSDPLFAAEGNDRWTEHVTRQFELLLHERLVDVLRGDHPGWHERAMVRRGFEDSWSQARPRRWTGRSPTRHRFTPASPVSAGLGALRYDLEASDGDEGFTPAYGPVLELPAQFARLRERDSLVVAVAADLGDMGAAESPDATLIISDGPDSFPLVMGPVAARERAVFLVRVPSVASVASLEATGRGAVGRARRGLVPLGADPLVISDIIFLAPGDEASAGNRAPRPAGALPSNRTEAAALMLGGEGGRLD